MDTPRWTLGYIMHLYLKEENFILFWYNPPIPLAKSQTPLEKGWRAESFLRSSYKDGRHAWISIYGGWQVSARIDLVAMSRICVVHRTYRHVVEGPPMHGAKLSSSRQRLLHKVSTIRLNYSLLLLARSSTFHPIQSYIKWKPAIKFH